MGLAETTQDTAGNELTQRGASPVDILGVS